MARQLVAPLVVAVVVLGVGTFLQGKFTERWGTVRTEKLQQFSARLEKVPKQVGAWVGEDHPFDELQQQQFEASHCDAFISRTYENQETGDRVNVYLVSGTARHVTIHTPEWCYQGAGYQIEGEPTQREVNIPQYEPTPQFLTATFLKEEPTKVSRLRIFWTFSDNGQWLGPRFEKAAFAQRPALMKLYLISEISRTDSDIQNDPAIRFARDFIPVINEILFSETPPAAIAQAETIETKG